MKLLPSRRVLCTPYNHAPCHFMQSHIRKVHAYLAVTCHLHFWQNDRGLLRATAATRGWNGYRCKSQHRTFTPENNILLLLLQGFAPVTFRSRVRRCNHWAIPVIPVFLLHNRNSHSSFTRLSFTEQEQPQQLVKKKHTLSKHPRCWHT